MDQSGTKSTTWNEGEWMAATIEPGVSVAAMGEEAPTLTVATIIGVTAVVLVAIAAVFLLGVLMDWRQQKLLEKKMGEVKRSKSRRARSHPDSDRVGIADQMEEPELTVPPAQALRDIP